MPYKNNDPDLKNGIFNLRLEERIWKN